MARLSGAACVGQDLRLFFPDDPGIRHTVAQYTDRVAAAKAICGRCPVAIECLAQAVKNREQYGIWGGLLPGERTEMLDQLRKEVDHAA